MKKVSIIVPVYNVKGFVTGCIESLINQSYYNIEIILVDDGSSDGSAALCDEYAKKDSRIKVIHKANGGLSSARNAGLAIASGDYIMFVDGDDYLTNNAVEILMNLMSTHPVDFVQFDYLETKNEYSKNINHTAFEPEIIKDNKVMFEKLYEIGGAAASACTRLYKKELFDNLSFKEGIIHEDEYFTTYLLQQVKSVMYINCKLYYYVMRQNSIVKSKFSAKRFDSLFVSRDRMEQLNKLGYFDLLEKEKTRYFLTSVSLWCSAKSAHDKISVKKATESLKYIISQPVALTGKFKILYNLCKININLLLVYYLYKKITNQV